MKIVLADSKQALYQAQAHRRTQRNQNGQRSVALPSITIIRADTTFRFLYMSKGNLHRPFNSPLYHRHSHLKLTKTIPLISLRAQEIE